MSRPVLIAVAAGIVAAVITVTVARVSPPVSPTLLRWAARHCFDTEELREKRRHLAPGHAAARSATLALGLPRLR